MRQSGNPLLLTAFATFIKARRNVLGISQEEAAGRAEIDRPYWTLMESGRKQPTLSVLHKMAFALEMSLADLCWETDQKYGNLLRMKTS